MESIVSKEYNFSTHTSGEFLNFGYQIKNRDQFAMYLKKAFGNGFAGNTINYVADIVRAKDSTHSEVKNNIFTAVVEHPFAESISEYKYELQWVEDVNPQTGKLEMKLKSDFGTLDDIYDEAVENNSGQIPKFEQKRNIRNRNLYTRLKYYRGNNIYEPVVEFSPSPEMTEEVRKRGYKGNDAIFVYEYKDGKEQVTQYWLDKQNFTKYKKLLSKLNSKGNNPLPNFDQVVDKNDLTDTDIMDCSDVLNTKQFEILKEFIDENKVNPSKYAKEIINYAENTIEPKIQKEIYPLVNSLAEDIANNNIGEKEIKEKLKIIMDNMARFQLELYLIQREGEVSNVDSISIEEYLAMSKQEQLTHLAKISFEFSGCGINEEIKTSVGIFGKSGGMTMDLFGMSTKEWSPVKCANSLCNEKWFVVNGKTETYKSECPKCGENMRC